MALACGAETTTKIVVSGICGLRQKSAEPKKRGQIKNEGMFRSAVPETTVFTVISGAHTGVVLADVPETTAKIVVSGTSAAEDTEADEDKQAEEKKNR